MAEIIGGPARKRIENFNPVISGPAGIPLLAIRKVVSGATHAPIVCAYAVQTTLQKNRRQPTATIFKGITR